MPTGVYVRSEEYKKSRKGIKLSMSHIANIIKGQKERYKLIPNPGNFKKGHIPFYTGKKMPLEMCKRMGDSRRGIPLSEKHKESIRKSLIGREILWTDKISKALKGKPRFDLAGEKAYQWKGNNVGYYALHKWIAKQLGKPHYCEHCGRNDLPHRSYNWANKSGKYLRELYDWLRLCVSCHRKYDINKKINNLKK